MESFEGFMLNEGQKISTVTEIDTVEINTKKTYLKIKLINTILRSESTKLVTKTLQKEGIIAPPHGPGMVILSHHVN